MLICPECHGAVKYYDHVKRSVVYGGNKKEIVTIKRYRCVECHKIHRYIPNSVLPHKHYNSKVIFDILEGSVDDRILEYEDYPSDATVNRWKSQKKQILLWRRNKT